MTTPQSQLKANANYIKHNVKQVSVRFFPSEEDLFQHMDSQGGRASYIKKLIREDMEKKKGLNK